MLAAPPASSVPARAAEISIRFGRIAYDQCATQRGRSQQNARQFHLSFLRIAATHRAWCKEAVPLSGSYRPKCGHTNNIGLNK
jgi:hypothetical protein